jgi:hypothetical protein
MDLLTSFTSWCGRELLPRQRPGRIGTWDVQALLGTGGLRSQIFVHAVADMEGPHSVVGSVAVCVCVCVFDLAWKLQFYSTER